MCSKKFLGKELSDIHLEADRVISSHLSRLDRVSSDIKTLEEVLKKSAIPFTFVYVLYSEAEYMGHEEPYFEIDSKVYAFDDHCLVWEQTDKGSRLYYNIYRTKHQFNINTKQEIDDKTATTYLKSSIPLIETKALFRLQIEKELPLFYKNLIKNLELTDKKDCYFFYSTNFKESSYPEDYIRLISHLDIEIYYILNKTMPSKEAESPYLISKNYQTPEEIAF